MTPCFGCHKPFAVRDLAEGLCVNCWDGDRPRLRRAQLSPSELSRIGQIAARARWAKT